MEGNPKLSDREVHFASEVARLARSGAYFAATHPGWGSLLVVGTESLHAREVVEPIDCSMGPVRLSEPVGELVRIDILRYGGVAISEELVSEICNEIAPFIVGVGKVAFEHELESIKIFRVDSGDVDGCHDGTPEIEITPEMIAAGARELVFDVELIREAVVYDILVTSLEAGGFKVFQH